MNSKGQSPKHYYLSARYYQPPTPPSQQGTMTLSLRTIAMIAAATAAVSSQAAAQEEPERNFHKRHIPHRPDRPVSHNLCSSNNDVGLHAVHLFVI